MTMTYASVTERGQIFIAERSMRERRFLWWMIPSGGKLDAMKRVAARDVPRRARRRAYRQMRGNVPTSFKDVTAEKTGTLIAIIPAPRR
jgi:hypothetical protein